MNSIVIKNDSKTILDSLREDYNIPVDASCGGKGTCGKCKVRILKGEVDPPDEEELKHLSPDEISRGYRLACRITPENELHVLLDHNTGPVQILEEHNGFSGVLNPLVKKKFIKLEKPSLENQNDDITRILNSLEVGELDVSLSLKQKIPSFLRDSDHTFTAVYNRESLLTLEEGDTSNTNYAIACDIGTTTIVIYLLDGTNGEIIGTKSDLNAQKPFGADVIARIDFTMNNPKGLDILQEKKISQLNTLIQALLKDNHIKDENLYSITIAGNTTMLHLLAGVNPAGIAAAPFIPAFLKGFSCSFHDLGVFFTDCLVYFMPSISAYVGADIVAGVLATAMNDKEDLSLLVDLGTNGEIILGNRQGFYSCSTAAGPAFEGAHISCGMGAVSGAINTFEINENVEYTVIGDVKPVGICGSAIVDIVSSFLDKGFIDETGRFAEADEINDETLRELFQKHYNGSGQGSFMLVPASQSGTGEDVLFTQKDIREVQLAKAAISAGIATLLHDAGKTEENLKHLYIAGGFGNYINKISAAHMGLIPSSLLDRSVSVGNTAGLGAINCSLSEENLTVCEEIVEKTSYIELSDSPWFQQKYMEEMVF